MAQRALSPGGELHSGTNRSRLRPPAAALALGMRKPLVGATFETDGTSAPEIGIAVKAAAARQGRGTRMNGKEGASTSGEGKRRGFWRGSVNEEPTWVSLAWIIGPALLAGIVIFFAIVSLAW
jgi:hypothetical protein